MLVVSRARPAIGGIPSFSESIASDPELRRSFDMRLLNTTRVAERAGGRWTAASIREAIVDAVMVFRAARSADVVHVQTALVPSSVALRTIALCRAAKLAGASVICHVHSAETSSGQHGAFVPSRLMRRLLRSLAFVEAVAVVSRPGADALRGLIPGVRIEVIDNAVDASSFVPAERNGSVPTLLFVGTLTRRKGVDDLLVALRMLRDRSIEFRAELVGGAAEAGEAEASSLREYAESMGFGDSLRGALSSDAVRDRMAAADVFVLPSHLEGQPISILEAMASGLPVVSTRTGAVPDVVRDGVDGFVVEVGDTSALADALDRVVADPELRASMGRSARARVLERFDMPRLRSRLTELYRSVV